MTTTNEDTQRDELAAVIAYEADRHHGFAGSNLPPAQQDRELADAILVAGYRKPRTITTVEELGALPLRSVIVDGSGYGTVYRKMHQAQDGVQWYEPGYVLNWDSLEITLPATVLHDPEAEVGA